MSEVTERDMLDLLLARYTAIRRATIADRWVRAEHVSSTLGHHRPGVSRIVDFVVADKYPGTPYGSALAFHGHEVKVTRSDWRTELRDLSKSEAWRRYMHFWWLVVPDAAIVRDGELPDGWGLLVKSGGGLRAKVRAARQEPEPMPADMCIALMTASARTAYREPLRRDAPSSHREPDWVTLCGFCGEVAPCSLHQPRATSKQQFKNPA
ncbi:Uncharacterised protein [Mycobacteroides abscessus subsp. abscessus]|uniref:hypothetical protein n=1 Tax=Mycobacteroides abscessus TaxID=36809 RepID=UPI0009259005|nr:hypothetical protein [Mycobacteroides abscessus]SIC52306.1 Uncharacterised protein [Mycobacteroides abscessus subsp. abscessus]SID07082.1 Uncharacterised protein [Mycobacteroides abscessus subsp. abscessus]SID34059.1 Uncharacterised protein [Mycobacteroides abscessus subsp. abscessus]SID63773.1 Uncharacterised protein [Mycobacteroides abscessus subsp. abscessus]SKT65689.1 Uncharacterised protein [Mycobacteroides abscessus subsp. abscessus]